MMPINRIGLTLCLILIQTWMAGAGPDKDSFYEIENGAQRMAALLESLPYASEGAGPVLYTFEYSECPYCQAMYRDYKVSDTGLTHRRVFVPVSERSARETAALGVSRDIGDYHAFMTGSRSAPAFNLDNTAIDAYNGILDSVQTFEYILKQNQWPLQGIRFPQFAWVENGKVFTSAGYEKSDFGKAVARAKKGGGTAEVWTQLATGSAAPTATPMAAPATPRQSTGLDVVGLEIGMTKDEVLAALKAHDPRMKNGEHPVKIVVQDSNRQQLEIGTYVKGLQAWLGHHHGIAGFDLNKDPTEKIVIYFSPPPAEQRVEFIGREVTYPAANAPDFHATLQSIAAKYGEPTQLTGDTTGSARVGLVTQIWQQSGPNLEGRQFNRWSNRSGLMAPLNYKGGGFHPVGGQRPLVTDDRTGLSLGILVNKQGHVVHMMRFMLTADKQAIEQNQAATWDLGQAALAEHEQQLRGAARQRGGPSL